MDQKMTTIASKKSSITALIVILAFIFSDILCENFIIIINNQQEYTTAILLLFSFMGLQILFSPIQAAFSDLGRKNALVISITFSLLSLLIIYLFLTNLFPYLIILFFAVLMKGTWGNTIALSWAAIADTQDKNYRPSYALSSGVYAVSYLILICLHDLTVNKYVLFFSTAIILFIAYILCIIAFKDSEDKTVKKNEEIDRVRNSSRGLTKYFRIFFATFNSEKQEIITEVKKKPTMKALLAYLLWSISMYSILISQIDLHRGDDVRTHIAIAMMIGYLSGVVILRLKQVKSIGDNIIMKWGYLISFFSLIPYFIAYPFFGNDNCILGICYFLHALGNAFLSPALLTIVTKEKPHHKRGKILGLVDSSDTIAFLLALVFVMIYNQQQLSLIYLVSFSFISFSISWIYYSRFQIVH